MPLENLSSDIIRYKKPFERMSIWSVQSKKRNYGRRLLARECSTRLGSCLLIVDEKLYVCLPLRQYHTGAMPRVRIVLEKLLKRSWTTKIIWVIKVCSSSLHLSRKKEYL
jgi:hypothetical protein